MKIVFATTPKKFNSTNIIRQTNTLRSLASLNVEKEILLFAEDDDMQAKSISKDLNIRFITDFKKSDHGNVPYINDLFERTENYCDADYYCFLNCDMILLNDFVDTMHFVNDLDIQNKKFFGCGIRWDTDEIKEIIDFNSVTYEEIKEMTMKGQYHAPCGIDYFIYEKNTFFDMPDFLAARAVFDNKIVGHAIHNPNIFELDISGSCLIIHQNHGYGKNSDLNDVEIKESFKSEFSHNRSLNVNSWSSGNNTNHCRNYLSYDVNYHLGTR